MPAHLVSISLVFFAQLFSLAAVEPSNLKARPLPLSHGSVVVISISEHGAVIAADSTEVVGFDERESVCKVTTIGDSFVVALTGISSSTAPNNRWRAITLASKAYGKVSAEPVDTFQERFAAEWGKQLQFHLDRDLRTNRYSNSLLSTLGLQDKLAVGSVVGITPGHGIKVTTVRIRHNQTGKDQNQPTKVDIETRQDEVGIRTTGEIDIVMETIQEKTARGRAWHAELNQKSRVEAGSSDAVFAIGLVDLTIKHLPPKHALGHTYRAVAGPIDAVRIDADRHIDWLQKKPICQ